MVTRVIGGVSYTVRDVENYLGVQYVSVADIPPASMPTLGAPSILQTYVMSGGVLHRWNGNAWVDFYAPGLPGSQGAQGEKGDKGDAGSQGAAGPKGETGNAGAAGAQGATGAKGDAGNTGPAGPQGSTGAQGATGPKGDTGNAGATGSPGANGTNGSAGAKGDTGAQGVQGIQGVAGAGASPSAPAAMSVAFGTAYQFSEPTKGAHINIMLESNYMTTLAGTSADEVEVRIGPTSAVATGGGSQVASWKTSLTGIALTVGLGLIQRNPVSFMLPIGWYFAVRRISGNTATIVSTAAQPLS